MEDWRNVVSSSSGSSSSEAQQRDQDWQLPNWDAQDAAAAPDTAAASSLDWDLHQQQQDLGERFAHWPANLAASAEGYHPLEFYPTSQINLEWGSGSLGSFGGAGSLDMGIDRSANLGKDTGKIFVILFGVGSPDARDSEGIYSLRAMEQGEDLPSDTVVAFENEDDAIRYSTLLEATMDHQPTVWPIEWKELVDFCNTSGYRCRLEPRGSLLIPPDINVGMTDWEKSVRLRRGEFLVLDSEPALDPEWHALSNAATFLEDLYAREPHGPQPAPQVDSNVVDAQLADPEQLAVLKLRLESLLPRE